MKMIGQLHDPVALPAVLIGQEAGWAPEPVWARRRRGKRSIIAPAGNWTPVLLPVAYSLY